MPRLLVAATSAALMLAAPCVQGQSYPARPIRLVLPVPPGGGADLVVRSLQSRLGAALGQQIIVDHRGGAGGNIAAELVAKAAPDGYTLLWVHTGISTNPSLYRKLNHDPVRDFSAITQVTSQSYVLAVHPSVPTRNVKEFVALSRTRKGGLSYASSGSGSLPHLGMEMLAHQAGIPATHVPYKGSGPGVIDLMAGQVDAMMPTLIAGAPFVKGGKLHALAVTSTERSTLLPEVPTVAEQGFRGFEVSGWYGMLAPAGTPRDAIALLHTEIARILRLPEVRERLAGDGAVAVGSPPETFGAYIRSEIAKWSAVIRASGATVE